jgi:hypothetical protein
MDPRSRRSFSDSTSAGRGVDAGTLWAGGVAAAAVSAGVALVGFLLVRGILDIRVLTPKGQDRIFDSSLVWYMAAAAAAALIATAIAHLLLLAVPEPMRFFSWIIGLVTVAAALIPFMTGADLDEKVATGLINLVIGLSILSIVGRVGRSSIARG